MAERVRTFISRLRAVIADRRYAPRYRARLPVRVTLQVRREMDEQRALSIEGYTFDLSASGIAATLPAVRVRGYHLTDAERKISVRLEISGEPVELLTVFARYEPLSMTHAGEKGYLFCVRIIDTASKDYAKYLAYLETLK